MTVFCLFLQSIRVISPFKFEKSPKQFNISLFIYHFSLNNKAQKKQHTVHWNLHKGLRKIRDHSMEEANQESAKKHDAHRQDKVPDCSPKPVALSFKHYLIVDKEVIDGRDHPGQNGGEHDIANCHWHALEQCAENAKEHNVHH